MFPLAYHMAQLLLSRHIATDYATVLSSSKWPSERDNGVSATTTSGNRQNVLPR